MHSKLPKLCFATLTAAYLLFIATASFYLTSAIPSAESALTHIFQIGKSFSFNFHNLRDIATNILLYLPLGVFVCLYQASFKKIKLISLSLIFGFLISLIVETIQAFVGRYSDLTDILSNGSGYMLGYIITYIALTHFHLSPSSLLGIQSESDDKTLKSISGLRFSYIAISYVTCILPLNISVSLSDIYAKFSSINGNVPRLILDPFYHFTQTHVDLRYLSLNFLMFLPLAFLSTYIHIKRRSGALFTPAFHCLLFGLFIEFSNIFIKSGRTDIAVPFLGFFTGLLTSYLCLKFSSASQNLSQENTIQANRYVYLSAAFIYALLLLTVSLSPFEFELSLDVIKQKLLHESNIIPFKAHFSARSISAAIDIVREVIQFAPLGALLALSLGTFRQISDQKIKIIFIVGILGGTYAGILETLQLTVVGRYVDLTDCFLAASGCVFGAIILPIFNTSHQSVPNPE
jgi:glycopeptide antibiotics resistance protein